MEIQRPRDLTTAMGLARLCERHSEILQAEPKHTMNRTNPPVARPAHMKQLSCSETEERRSRGLCFNCDELFAPGHQSKRLFRLEVVEDGALDDKNSNKNLDDLGISLYAITGATDGHTMQVMGCIHSLSLRILIDSGSTHYFLATTMVACLGPK